MQRTYDLTVSHKQESGSGANRYHSILLLRPTIDGNDFDIHRPWWVDKTNSGTPLWLDVTPEEFASLAVGDRFTVTLDGPAA